MARGWHQRQYWLLCGGRAEDRRLRGAAQAPAGSPTSTALGQGHQGPAEGVLTLGLPAMLVPVQNWHQ